LQKSKKPLAGLGKSFLHLAQRASGQPRGKVAYRNQTLVRAVKRSGPIAFAAISFLYVLLVRPLVGPLRRIRGPIGRFSRRHRYIVTWVVRRSITAVAQLLVVILIVYAFFYVLVPGSPSATPSSVFTGWANMVQDLFTGQWGTISIGGVFTVSTYTYISYYLPYTIELAVVALAISLAVAYPLGLFSGWHRGRILDGVTRGYVAIWLFFPAVIFAFLLIVWLYLPFAAFTGDTLNSLFETLPGTSWPSWIGVWGNTSPTGFPLIDPLLHRDWSMEETIVLKVLVEALCIVPTYMAIFLRYARGAAVETTDTTSIKAARARGVPERRLLWHHAGRRILPIYIFAIGNTIGAYIMIQAMIELIFDTHGVLYLLLYNAGLSLLGGGVGSEEALLIALIFLIAIVILFVNIAAEAVSMALDPTWTTGEGGSSR
jgi:peptide/nickel transport system permease protein